MEGGGNLIFTQHVLEGAWFITIATDPFGNLMDIMAEPLFYVEDPEDEEDEEFEIEFEMDFEI